MGEIIFNGISSKEYDIQVEHPPGYQTPERDCDIIHVPGRNGDIIIDKHSYKNVERTYEIAVGSIDKDFVSLVNPISEWLNSGNGYYRLEDSYEPEYYRIAMFNDAITIENIMFHGGRTTISFNCKPQRFFKSGDMPIVFKAFKTTTNEKLNILINALRNINDDVPYRISYDEITMNIVKENRTIEISSDIQNQMSFIENAITQINEALPYKITFSNLVMTIADRQRIIPSGEYSVDQKISILLSCINDINNDIPFKVIEQSSNTLNFVDYTRETGNMPPDYKGYSGGFIRNVTRFESLPVINIYGLGMCNLTIGNYTILVSEVGGNITIDSQLLEVYSGDETKNQQVTLSNGFPKLLPGNNAFSYTGSNIERVEVIPKWWTL